MNKVKILNDAVQMVAEARALGETSCTAYFEPVIKQALNDRDAHRLVSIALALNLIETETANKMLAQLDREVYAIDDDCASAYFRMKGEKLLQP